MGTTAMQSAAAPPPSRPMAQASPDQPAPMAMTVAEMEADIAALPRKKDALREAFDRLAACSPSPLPFAWEDLDGHISSLQSSIALRFRQLRVLEAARAAPAAAVLGGTRGDGKGENQEELEEEEEEEVEVEVEEEVVEAELEKKDDEEMQEADGDKIGNDEKDGKEASEVEVVAELERADEDMPEPDSNKIWNGEKEARKAEVEEMAELEKKTDEEMQEASYDQICNDEKEEAREEVEEEGEVEEAANVMIGSETKDEEEAREEEQDPDKAMQMVDKDGLDTKDAFKASQDKQEEDKHTSMDETVAKMASSVQFCGKKRKQEKEAQEQDVHDKVEGAKNATDKEAAVANEVLLCRSDVCANMDAQRLVKLICTNTEFTSEFHAAVRRAPDAAALALHVVELFLHTKIFKTRNVWASCVRLVQMVPVVVTKPSADTIEQAKRVAKDWKEMIDNPESRNVDGSLASWGLLNFLICYNIVTEFDTKAIFCLFGNLSIKEKKKSAMLLKGLGLGNRIPELMDYLIKNGQQMDVFWLARSFHMVHKYPPLPLLMGYVENAKQIAMEISQKNMTHQLRWVITKELDNLRRAHILANKKEITNSKLRTSISKDINILIGEFEKMKRNLENPLKASTSNSQQQQTESKKKPKIEQKQEHHKGQENQMRGQLSGLTEKLEEKERKSQLEQQQKQENKPEQKKQKQEVEPEKKTNEEMQESSYDKICNDEKEEEAREEVVEEGEVEEAANIMIGSEIKDKEEAREEEQDPDKAMQMVDKDRLDTKDAFKASQDKEEEDQDANMDETVAKMASSVQACGKKQEQELEAHEQDVHDKVEGAKNATDKEAVVANEVSSDRGNQALPCTSDDCTVACTNMDAERLLKLIWTNTKLSSDSKFHAAFRCAPDAAALALHVVELFLHSKRFLKTRKVWASCVRLVQMVPVVVTKPSANTIEQAKRVAKDWKETIDNLESRNPDGSLASWGLLNFLISYNIVTEFDMKEIFLLFGNISLKEKKQSAMLLKGLGLENRIPELMDYLIKNGQQMDVFWLARSFHMEHKYPPLSLLKGYVEKAKQNAMEISQENMTHQLRWVIIKELENLRRAHVLANKKEIIDPKLCTSIRKDIDILIGEFEKKRRNLEAKQKQEDKLEEKKRKQDKPEEKKWKHEDKPEEKQHKRLGQCTPQLPTQGYPAMWNAALSGDLEHPPYAAMHGVYYGYPAQPGWPFMPQLGAREYIGPFTPFYPPPEFYPR